MRTWWGRMPRCEEASDIAYFQRTVSIASRILVSIHSGTASSVTARITACRSCRRRRWSTHTLRAPSQCMHAPTSAHPAQAMAFAPDQQGTCSALHHSCRKVELVGLVGPRLARVTLDTQRRLHDYAQVCRLTAPQRTGVSRLWAWRWPSIPTQLVPLAAQFRSARPKGHHLAGAPPSLARLGGVTTLLCVGPGEPTWVVVASTGLASQLLSHAAQSSWRPPQQRRTSAGQASRYDLSHAELSEDWCCARCWGDDFASPDRRGA